MRKNVIESREKGIPQDDRRTSSMVLLEDTKSGNKASKAMNESELK